MVAFFTFQTLMKWISWQKKSVAKRNNEQTSRVLKIIFRISHLHNVPDAIRYFMLNFNPVQSLECEKKVALILIIEMLTIKDTNAKCGGYRRLIAQNAKNGFYIIQSHIDIFRRTQKRNFGRNNKISGYSSCELSPIWFCGRINKRKFEFNP